MNQSTCVKIAYIGGGSTGWAKKLMSDLLLQDKMNGVLSLYDIDEEASLRNKLYFEKLMGANQDNVLSEWVIQVTSDSKRCLEGSDFVVMSITPGTLENMRNDVHYPEKYNIYQSVGDTVGVGGYSRALRTIPIYIEYAKQIEKYCPNAWVINYTNPMSIATYTLYKTFPKIKAFGCCHEVFKSQKLLLEAYKEKYHVKENIPINEVKFNLQGINHFTWITEARYNRIDLIEVYREFVKKYKDTGFDLEKSSDSFKHADGSFKLKLQSLERVKMDLFDKYGVMAAAGDRHLAEFIPRKYLINEESVSQWDFYLTRIEDRYSNLEEKINHQRQVIKGDVIPQFEPSGEEGVHQMLAILGYHDFVTNVNLPNKGQIPNLALGAIVETNAYFANDFVKPVFSGKMQEDIKEVVECHLNNQVQFVDSYFNQDIKGLFNAFSQDPSIIHLDNKDKLKLFRELIILNGEYNEDWVVSEVQKEEKR